MAEGETEDFVRDEVTWHCLVLVYTFLYCAMTAHLVLKFQAPVHEILVLKEMIN
jgi:hypothetical protein